MKRHLEEYVFPMIRKMNAIPAVAKNSFGTASANMQRAIVQDRRRRKHVAGRMHAARHLRRRIAAVSAQRFAG